MISKSSVAALLLSLGLAAGCATTTTTGSATATPTPEPEPAAEEPAEADVPSEMPGCALEIEGTEAAFEDIDDGVAVLFTNKAGNIDALRQRIHDRLAFGKAHPQDTPFAMTKDAEDIKGGIRLNVHAVEAKDVSKVRGAVRKHVQHTQEEANARPVPAEKPECAASMKGTTVDFEDIDGGVVLTFKNSKQLDELRTRVKDRVAYSQGHLDSQPFPVSQKTEDIEGGIRMTVKAKDDKDVGKIRAGMRKKIEEAIEAR